MFGESSKTEAGNCEEAEGGKTENCADNSENEQTAERTLSAQQTPKASALQASQTKTIILTYHNLSVITNLVAF